jgi:hypothetical protein
MKKNNEKALKIPQETFEGLSAAFKPFEDMIAEHGVTFTAKERMTSYSAGIRRKPFVLTANAFAKENPKIRPGYMDIDEFNAHCENMEGLDVVIKRMEGILIQLKNMSVYASANAVGPANECLASAARAMKRNVAGAEHAVTKMRESRLLGAKKAVQKAQPDSAEAVSL